MAGFRADRTIALAGALDQIKVSLELHPAAMAAAMIGFLHSILARLWFERPARTTRILSGCLPLQSLPYAFGIVRDHSEICPRGLVGFDRSSFPRALSTKRNRIVRRELFLSERSSTSDYL